MDNSKYHSEIVKAVAKNTGNTQAAVSKIIDAYLSEVSDSLNEGTMVNIRDFGSFRMVTRAARQGRNPYTGEMMDIPEKQVVTFKTSSKFELYSQIHNN